MVITEKLDGTNAQIYIYKEVDQTGHESAYFTVRAGSRNRWISEDDDNYGFAKWVKRNIEELCKLGEGRHFGEWWGNGIQRGYGLKEKRFSLFNTHRWSDDTVRPSCCHVVPVIGTGIFDTNIIDEVLEDLKNNGSIASAGFMKPEGIVIFHKASSQLFKKTIEKDQEPKGKVST